MAYQAVEPRDVATLRINDLAIGLFKPYPVKELEEFNRHYNEDLERPVETTMGGLIIQGRKRCEAARLRAYTHRRKEMLPCIVYPVTDIKEIYRLTLERMIADRDHPDKEDIALAQMCWDQGFNEFGRLDRFIRTATQGALSSHSLRLRTKIYGSPVVTYEIRRYIEDGLIEASPAAQLIQRAEKEFGGGHGAAVLPHRMPAARRRLLALVEAYMRGEKSPRTASRHVTGSPKKDAPRHTTTTTRIETDNLWDNILQVVMQHYISGLQADPLLGPIHSERARAILHKLETEAKEALLPLIRVARDKMRDLRVQASKQASLSFNNGVSGELKIAYTTIRLDPLPPDMDASEALDKIKQQYRSIIVNLHPDKGGEHDEASELNEAYKQLKDYWNSKRNGT